MVQFSNIISTVLLATTANGLTSHSKLSSRSMATPHRSNQIKHLVDYRSHRQSNSRLTSTHVEARPVCRPLLGLIPRKVVSSLRSLPKTFKRRRPQRILIGSVLAIILLFGPAFSPAANAASSVVATAAAAPSVTAAAPTVLSTHPRALGTFNLLPTKAELELCFRLLYAACSGAFIGLERSSQDRPAGVRTMALVGLGACIYTVCSTHGFLPASALGYAPNSPMLSGVKCDLSRMAANVASGVGFIGAGAIHKSKMHGNGTEAQNVVAGLTTAAAIWVSAAVGVASATGLYFVAGVAALSTVSILRFAKVTKEDEPGFSWGPRPLEMEDENMYHEQKTTQLKLDLHHVQDKQDGVSPQVEKTTSRIDIKGSNIAIKYTKPKGGVKKENQAKSKGFFGYDPNDHHYQEEEFGKTSTMDPNLEQFLRNHDKNEAYACLEQDVRAVESRVHNQNSSSSKP